MGHFLLHVYIILVINLVFLIYLLMYVGKRSMSLENTQFNYCLVYNVTFVEVTSCLKNMNRGQLPDRYDRITSSEHDK